MEEEEASDVTEAAEGDLPESCSFRSRRIERRAAARRVRRGDGAEGGGAVRVTPRTARVPRLPLLLLLLLLLSGGEGRRWLLLRGRIQVREHVRGGGARVVALDLEDALGEEGRQHRRERPLLRLLRRQQRRQESLHGARALAEETRVKGLVRPRVLRHEVIGRRVLPRDRAHQRPVELVDESLEGRPALRKRGAEVGTWLASKDSDVQRAPSLITADVRPTRPWSCSPWSWLAAEDFASARPSTMRVHGRALGAPAQCSHPPQSGRLPAVLVVVVVVTSTWYSANGAELVFRTTRVVGTRTETEREHPSESSSEAAISSRRPARWSVRIDG